MKRTPLPQQLAAIRATPVPPGHWRARQAKARELARLEAKIRSRYRPDYRTPF